MISRRRLLKLLAGLPLVGSLPLRRGGGQDETWTTSSLPEADTPTLEELDAMAAKARSLSPPLRSVMIDGKEQYLIFVHEGWL